MRLGRSLRRAFGAGQPARAASARSAEGQAATEPPDPDVEEIRLAMAWNGGVSLSIWMGGVAVELDCARRSWYGVEPDGRSVYHALSQVFRRVLVIDIIAGASAGGVNGALLAGAIQSGRRLDPTFLRNKWLDLGDFSKLLQPTTKSAPASIMQGDLFLEGLTETFQSLMGPDASVPGALRLPTQQANVAPNPKAPDDAPADVLLDIEVTNVFGRQRHFADEWGQEMVATEFRSPVKFRLRRDYKPPTLAVAARASASFPVAFEPQKLLGRVPELASLPPYERFAIDGGLLENAPISSAIALIPTRSAARPVSRFLCYVNAAPSTWSDDSDVDQAEPSLKDVLGYVVNLPRDGRFVDQLIAVETASRRAFASEGIQEGLLTMDRLALVSTAAALLPAYRRRRALASLDEAVTEPGGEPDAATARLAFKAIETNPDLPWIPSSSEAFRPTRGWRWGVRPAQRIVHTQLDILRELHRNVPKDEQPIDIHAEIHTVRELCQEHLRLLNRIRQNSDANPEIRELARELASGTDVEATLVSMQTAYAELFGGPIRQSVEETLRYFGRLLVRLAPLNEAAKKYRTAFFGAAGGAEISDHDLVERALERLLSIEVVRRSMSDDDDIDIAQPLRFAQLTPEAPGLVFSKKPFSYPGPNSGEQKLTGIRLGHFAGFYRRSWRANDYMWGRLDAATRISDLLVKHGSDDAPQLDALRDALAPDGDAASAQDLRELVHEALLDAKASSKVTAAVSTALQDYQDDRADATELRRRLMSALAADLASKDLEAGLFTRVVCARAAQYEVLRQELPCLNSETTDDRKLGCFTRPLGLTLGENGASILAAIDDLRSGWPDPAAPTANGAEPQPLPRRLGRDVPDEETSSLALRTITQALLVALAAVGGVAPLGKVLGAARVPILGVAGVAARGVIQRAALILGFAGSAFYVTARLVSSGKGAKPPFGALWDPAVLLSWTCFLALAGVVFVPAWRALRTGAGLRKGIEWTFAVALAVTGGLLAIGFAIWKLGLAVTVTTAGGFKAPHWIVSAVLAVALTGAAAVRWISPKWLPGFLTRRIERRTTGAMIIGVAAATLLGVSATTVGQALTDTGTWWHIAASACALFSAFACAAYVVADSSVMRLIATRLRGAVGRGTRAAPTRPGGFFLRRWWRQYVRGESLHGQRET